MGTYIKTCPTRRARPAKDAGQAGQAALGFARFVGEVRVGAAAGLPRTAEYPEESMRDETRAVSRHSSL